VLTIIFVFIFLLHVSYTNRKYSDFGYFGFYKIFQILGYNRIMIEAVLVYLALGIVIAYMEIKDDILNKKISQGYNPNARDGDGDGIVQEGTKWERTI
jgi:hypothetical protein